MDDISCGHCKGTDVKGYGRLKKPKKDRSMCVGCEDDFYNGRNNLGVEGCWSFKNAKIIKRLSVRVDQPPPYDKKKWTYKLSCFHRKQMCYPSPDVITDNGYWKS